MRDATWRVVTVNINLQGGTTTSTPIKMGCLTANSPTTDWTFYPTWSGTIQKAGQAPLSITGSLPMQIGVGANTQDITEFGGYGKFKTPDNQVGLFAFKLLNPTSCSNSSPLISNSVFRVEGKSIYNKIKLDWVENTAQNGEVFVIEKLQKDKFERLNIVKNTEGGGVHTYVSFDNNPQEGLNTYKITLLKNDGTAKESPLIEVKMEKAVYPKIYPNPSESYVNIALNDPADEEVMITVTNIFGHRLKEIKTTSNQTVEIDVSELPSGVYSVYIKQKGKRDFSQKLVIQN